MPIDGLFTGARGYGLFGASGPASAFVPIATVSPTQGATSVLFDNIPQTFFALHIRGISRDSIASGAEFFLSMQLNGNNAANYNSFALNGNGVSAFSSDTAPGFQIDGGLSCGNDAATGLFGVTIIDIHGYTSTQQKSVRIESGVDQNGSGRVCSVSGYWSNEAAITSITLAATVSGFQAGSTFSLYGIRGLQ